MAHGIPFISNDTHPWVDIDTNLEGFVSPLHLIYQQSEMIIYTKLIIRFIKDID